MKFYWREGHSNLLHTPDMLSRALYEYDGSKLPDQNGYARPFEYRDCPVFNALNGIWDPSRIPKVSSTNGPVLRRESSPWRSAVAAGHCRQPRGSHSRSVGPRVYLSHTIPTPSPLATHTPRSHTRRLIRRSYRLLRSESACMEPRVKLSLAMTPGPERASE
jgi:hypothetical protein